MDGSSSAKSAGAAGAPKTITLLTGDRVIVQPDGQLAIDPGPDRRGAGFRSYVVRGHQYVVPDDAARLIATGSLDRRLFDITRLLELGYDDAHRADLPVIVTERVADRVERPGQRGAARASHGALAKSGVALAAGGASVVRRLPGLRGAAMRVSKRSASAAWSALAGQARSAPTEGGTVWLDGKRKLVLDRSAPQIGAPAAWEAGYTGVGVTVAVLDTGIDAEHPDFTGRILDARSFLDDTPSADDEIGHGTHVASIMAGSGAGDGGVHRGVAPDATLLVGKVCGDGGCPDSAILAGLEWAATSGATVVNLSFGGEDTDEVDPVEQAIDALTAEHGTLFVASAGNEGNCGGPDFIQVGSPSTADAAFSVGAVDSEDELAEFSCRGPRVGDGAIKPDITAPGVAIGAARAAGTELGDDDPIDDFYARLSGTSMAAPHVAGAAALLAQQHPAWRATELKAALMGSALPGEAGPFDQGAGRVDVARAIDQSVFATPASLSLGRAPWPHGDDEPAVRIVTYRNGGAAPLTLQLSVEASGPDGAAAAGMFTVEPEALAIPAGGEAQATLTVDTRAPGADGLYTGALIATAGEAIVRTPLAIDKEVESYDLDLSYIDRGGNPAFGAAILVDLDDDDAVVDLGAAVGATSVRVPRGRYNLEALVLFEADGFEVSAIFVQPVLDVNRATAVSLDARAAQPVDIRVPRGTARRQLEVIAYSHRTADFRWSGQYTYFGSGDEPPGFVALYTAHLGAPLPEAEFFSSIVSQWSEPHAPGSTQTFADSPYSYYLQLFPRAGRFPTGFARQIRHRDLATVHAEYGGQATSSSGSFFSNGIPSGIQAPPSQGATSVFRLPTSRTEYYSTENLIWLPAVWESVDGQLETFRITVPAITYEAGRTYRARWDAAVIGPGLSAPLGNGRIVRSGDELSVSLESLYSDASGHAGGSFMAENQIRLHRDGALIGESDAFLSASFEVPAEPGKYLLEVASVGGRSRLSTDVRVAWTFDSQHVAGPEPAVLPVMTVEFAPKVDEFGRVPAGDCLAIPIAIERQAGAPSSPVRRVTVEASHDRGASWQAATVVRFGNRGFAIVEHPDEAGTVSLRARAVAESGEAVDQTILDAYAIDSVEPVTDQARSAR